MKWRHSSIGIGLIVLLVALLLSSLRTPSIAAPATVSSPARTSGKVGSLVEAVHLGARAEEYVARGAYAAAEPLYRDALATFEAIVGPNAIQIVGPLHNLARLYRSWGRLDQAASVYRREADLFEKELGPNNLPLGLALADLADISAAQGRDHEAERLYRRGLAMVESALGMESTRTVTVLEHYTALLVKLNRTAEAEALTKRIRDGRGLSAAGSVKPWIILPALAVLGVVYVLLPVGVDVFSRYRHRKHVHCPADGRVAHIQIDARHAAVSTVCGRPSLRVTSCSLWPERLGCRRACLTLPSAAMRDVREQGAV